MSERYLQIGPGKRWDEETIKAGLAAEPIPGLTREKVGLGKFSTKFFLDLGQGFASEKNLINRYFWGVSKVGLDLELVNTMA